MAHVITDNQHYINIANAIRDNSFGNIEGPLSVTELPQRIREISTIGQAEGRAEGYAQGLEEGKQVGIQTEYDRFWDEYQCNGKKANYRCAFNGYGWTAKNFYPKYDIKGSNSGYQTFMFFNNDSARILEKIDLSQRLKDCGVTFDCSGSEYMDCTFYGTNVSVIPEVSTVGCTGQLTQVFYNPYVETIEKLILRDDGVQKFYNTFNNATSLKNIVIEGTIGKNGFNVSWSPLTHDSLMSIINALQDKTGDTSASWAVTLGADNLAKLTDAEKAIATQRGWTLA